MQFGCTTHHMVDPELVKANDRDMLCKRSNDNHVASFSAMFLHIRIRSAVTKFSVSVQERQRSWSDAFVLKSCRRPVSVSRTRRERDVFVSAYFSVWREWKRIRFLAR